jgi:hypothetical protein
LIDSVALRVKITSRAPGALTNSRAISRAPSYASVARSESR